MKSELYSIFHLCDSSIMKLNSSITGAQFKFIPLPILQRKFSEVFGMPAIIGKQLSEIPVEKQDTYQKTIGIHLHFSSAIMTEPSFNFVSFNKGIIFLKSDILQSDSTNYQPLDEHNKLSNDIVKALRLTTKGNFHVPLSFQIMTDSRQVICKHHGTKGSFTDMNFIKLDDNDAEMYCKVVEKITTLDKSLDLAFTNFNIAYGVNDLRVRYISFVTALESIFNHASAPISHTIARHLSLIISNDLIEFKSHYARVKKIYGLRSKLVHGSSGSITLEELEEVEDYCRKALLFCLKENHSKQSLFDFCNQSGVSLTPPK